jgi:hypothetical protein
MKKLIITESEKQRILGMHSHPSLKTKLFEQSTDAKLNEILSTNNNAAWQFINAITASEKAGTAGTVDEDKIVELVNGINTVDKYVAILWNIRNNVEGNWCSVSGFATKRMFQEDNSEEVKMVGYLGDIDKGYRDSIINKLKDMASATAKYYGNSFFKNILPKESTTNLENDANRLKKGCKGDWTKI